MAHAARPDLTEDDMRRIVREELVKHDELSGRDTATAEARAEIRKDAEFTRRMRERIDAAASKVGYMVLTAIVTAVFAVFYLGLKKSGH